MQEHQTRPTAGTVHGPETSEPYLKVEPFNLSELEYAEYHTLTRPCARQGVACLLEKPRKSWEAPKGRGAKPEDAQDLGVSENPKW